MNANGKEAGTIRVMLTLLFGQFSNVRNGTSACSPLDLEQEGSEDGEGLVVS